MKKKKVNLIIFYDFFLPNTEENLVEILNKIGFNTILAWETEKIDENEYFFVLTDYLHLAITEIQNKKEKIYVSGEKTIGLYLKGKTYKDNIKISQESVTLEIPDEYIYKNIKLYEMDIDEYMPTLSYPPFLTSFLYKINFHKYMAENVFFISSDNVLIDWEVKIHKGVTIHPNTVIKGKTEIKRGAEIFPFTYIENSTIGENAKVLPFSHIVDSILEKNTSVGPYSRLRQNTIIKEGAKTGDFVEMKNTVFGKESKAMHLSYVGDATVGKNVNIGAGTITCNYDGIKKNPTIIEDNVFVGSGTELVAPVKIKKNSYIAAGSTITKEVPEGALGIARARQENKEGWVERRKKRK